MKSWCIALLLLLLLVTSLSTPAQVAPGDTAQAALDQRADKLAHSLRCMVCQNQSLADSNAPLAQDMRTLIHQQLLAGKTDPEIMSFFEARYGDFVRYDPPFKPSTWLLWLTPFALLLLGFFALWMNLRVRAERIAGSTLSLEDRANANQILDEKRP